MIRLARLSLIVVITGLVFADSAGAQRTRQRQQRVDPLTSSVHGKVTTADTGAPVRGAEVRLSSDGRYSRLVTTNGDGVFELRDLPAGDYKLIVSRTGFISLQFGQRRPFDTASTITLAEGQTVEAGVALIRGGAIYGRVFDQYHDAAVGMRVQVLRSRVVQGRRRLQSVGAGDQTDDTGAYRIYGLPPGDYYVIASGGPVDAVKRDPPIYYPGTPNFAEAQPLTLGTGAEATAEFQMVSARNARISGVVLNSAGAPVEAMINVRSQVVALGPGGEPGPSALDLHADARADGMFTVENVPPGPYTITAMMPFAAGRFDASGQAAPFDPLAHMPESTTMPLVVSGDITDLSLVTRAVGRISGRFVADTGIVRRLPSNLRVSVRSTSGSGVTMSMGISGGEEFTLSGVSGLFQLDVQGVPDDWVVKAILMNGIDVTDEPFELKNGSTEVRVVMTDRLTSVTGRVQSRDSAGGQNVIVFTDDAMKWTWPSRFVKTARTDAQGGFVIRGLPAGERYLAAALDYLEDGEEQDPQLLERLRSRANGFSLGEGEQRSIQLDVIGR